MTVKVGKLYKSVRDMLRVEHPEHVDSYDDEHGRQQISQTLFLLRTYHGVTQAEIAQRMGVAQSTIAKLEDRGDNVKVGDVVAFARALNHGVTLQIIDNKLTKADQLRWHLEQVVRLMAELEEMAGDDHDIKVGVLRHFTIEVKKMLHEVLPKFLGVLAPLFGKKAQKPESDLTIAVQTKEDALRKAALVAE